MQQQARKIKYHVYTEKNGDGKNKTQKIISQIKILNKIKISLEHFPRQQ